MNFCFFLKVNFLLGGQLRMPPLGDRIPTDIIIILPLPPPPRVAKVIANNLGGGVQEQAHWRSRRSPTPDHRALPIGTQRYERS